MTTMTSKLDELKSDVYKAAKDGDVNELRRLVEAMEKGDVAEIVSSKTDDVTPLIVACREGHAEVVQYLVDECAADIEQTGIGFGWEEEITPLWCAVAEEYLDIVKLLVTRGADVNSATCKLSTPLNEACLCGNDEIIEYLLDNNADINGTDLDGATGLMLHCRDVRYYDVEYLIERGADINRKDRGGDTALHYCVSFCPEFSTPDSDEDSDSESGSAGSMRKIMQLLVQCKVKMEKNADGLTPLLLAADNANEDVMEYLIAIAESERTERIEAFELLGARYVANNDMTSAWKYWKLAMEERFRVGCDVIQKPVSQQPNAAYGNAVEVNNLDELNDMISDEDAMQMQALLVRERILGPGSPSTLSGLQSCGYEYVHRGSLDKCLRLWAYALDMLQKFFEPLHIQTAQLLLSCAEELFSSMMTQKLRNVDFDIFMGILEKSVSELQRAKKAGQEGSQVAEKEVKYNDELLQERFSDVLLTTLNIIGLMCRIQERLSEQQVHRLNKASIEFVKLNLRDDRGYTPLHLTCEGSVHIKDFVLPSEDVAKILIECGASVNARDNNHGNTPLHVAAESTGLWKEDLMAALLEKGAHFDACNFVRVTPMDLLRNTNADMASSFALKHQTLQCLAARVIVANDIPYKGGCTQRAVPSKSCSFAISIWLGLSNLHIQLAGKRNRSTF